MKNVYATVSLDIVRTDLATTDLGDLFDEWGLFTQAQEVMWIVTYDPMAQLRSVVEVARGSGAVSRRTAPGVLSTATTASPRAVAKAASPATSAWWCTAT